MSVIGSFISLSKAMLISVVIPTCHRNDLLARCLDCLAPGKQAGSEIQGIKSQFYSQLPLVHYEVVVTDDGSRTTAQKMVQRSYPWAKWVAGPRKGPAANRNHGAKHTSGQWLAFVDDDCLPDKQWLSSLVMTAQKSESDVIEGKTLCPDKGDSPFEDYVENQSGGCFWSCNLAIRRTSFLQLRGFDEAFLEAGGEDLEFAWRLKEHHVKNLFVSEFLVLHPARRLTWRKIWWRTLLIRWVLLYRLRTRKAPPLEASPWHSVLSLVLDRIMDLLRTTYHLISKFDRNHWRRSLTLQLWKWVTFPFILPYLILWEFRFRTQLKRMAGSS